jgi:uncharacterized protein (DUF488 family)
MKNGKTHSLFTTGYEGKELPVFLDCLEARGIECILDVRETPFSRKPGFSKGPLARALEARGIQYIHLKELGTPRSLRDAVKSDGDYRTFFKAMERHLATRQESIELACRHAMRTTCCLLCYEKSVDACHRRIVARMIQQRAGAGLDVIHL